MLLLRLVVEGVKEADFVDAARTVQGIEEERVLLRKLGRLDVAATLLVSSLP